MERLTKEQKDKMYYRQIILNDRMKQIINLINGRSSSFYPFILDEKGKISDEKADKFISELLDGLKDYFRITGQKSLNNDTAEMYSTFLYCALMGLKSKVNRRCPSVEQTAPSQTFADIIEFAEYLEPENCDNYDDFLMWEYGIYRGKDEHCSYFFDCISESLRMLGFVFVKDLPREVQTKLCNEYAKKNNISEQENKIYIDDAEGLFESDDYLKWMDGQAEKRAEWERENSDDAEKLMQKTASNFIEEEQKNEKVFDAINSLEENESYADNAQLREMSAEEIKSYEEKKAEREMIDEAQNWRENLVNNLRLYDSYEKFTKLYFKIDHADMVNDIRNMVDTFLFEHKISSFSFGEKYGLITYQIEKMQSHIELEIERSSVK